jgi:5-oxopent-3-ene-1,2,5-tricarboxylate decarboxylase / 2-hydroxyhepta-2,4-diene-1,7-dioate isomerase
VAGSRRDYSSQETSAKLPASLVEAVRETPTGVLSDLLERVEDRSFAIAGLTPLGGVPARRVLGRAVTVRFAPVSGPHRFSEAPFLSSTVVAEAEPGDVIVLAAGDADFAFFGERMAEMARAAGVAGIVVDGGVRDVDGIAALDLPVFHGGVTPRAYLDHYEAVAVNDVVHLGGAAVAGGDLLVGDSDGLVVVPARAFAVVERLVAELEALETWIEDAVAAGRSPESVYPEVDRRLRGIAERAR